MIKNLILGIVTLSLFSCGTSVDLTPIAFPKDKIEMLGSLGTRMEIKSDIQIELKQPDDLIVLAAPIRFKIKSDKRISIENTINEILYGCKYTDFTSCSEVTASLTLNNSKGFPNGIVLKLNYDQQELLKTALKTGSEEFDLIFVEGLPDSDETAADVKDIGSATINLVIGKR